MRFTPSLLLILLFFLLPYRGYSQTSPAASLRAVNEDAIPAGEKTIAIVGATLIDGRGGDPLPDACVIVKGNTIVQVGAASTISLPPEPKWFLPRG